MANEDLVWFRSKIDWWLWPLLFVPPLTSLAVLSSGLTRSNGEDVLVGGISCVVVGALYGLFVIPVRYGIGSEELVIRFGVFRVHIRLDRIVRVSPTRNPLSSPALSIDRIVIRAGPGIFSSTMISPDDREVFLSMLANRARLSRNGDELVRV